MIRFDFEGYFILINVVIYVTKPKHSKKLLKHWSEFSNYTGSPFAAAKTISSSKTVYNIPNNGFWNAVIDLKNEKTFPPLIMLTDSDETVYIKDLQKLYGIIPSLEKHE